MVNPACVFHKASRIGGRECIIGEAGDNEGRKDDAEAKNRQNSGLMKREHAAVMGASVAGLLAARVLADYFEKVTVLEKDACPADSAARAGVPQGRHTHILLPSGALVLERLFPGRLAELVRDGAKKFDYGRSRFYVVGTWLPRVATNLESFAQTRPFLEEHLRRWVGEIPNVHIVYETNVFAPLFDLANGRVVGLEIGKTGAAREQLHADLVIDATGRHSRLSGWLAENGFGDVPETKIGIDLAYATGLFQLSADALPDHPMLYIVGPPPEKTRVGVVFQVENGIAFGGLAGYHGDYPPADLPGFLEFAKSLSQPDVFNVLSRAKLCTPIAQFRIPTAARRHFQKMRRFPPGILPLGDAICSLDPAFGQGMTVAALEAEILSRCLLQGLKDEALRRAYLPAVDTCIDVPWTLCCTENFKYPQTTGPRPFLFPLVRRYVDSLTTSGDPAVLAAIYRVFTLTAHPRILLRPDIAARALSRKISRGIERPGST
jgi:2-polyprenyl-6-methoxyphenol hydroxylase-like FAD-dependent oxidoreductase